ncbi:hypothetical protein CSKR_101555 [Clonorchis sinensis]|uniref:Uncharacterized protein n=1 Tax=Clonorchis sinensis TaxID=79923 RepID=A0A419PSB1_CLOSI|nr:hypothetical protein CSKR_101555 [Clonorchis sinensis]
MAHWLECDFTARRVRGSNPTSVSRRPLSRHEQPGSIPALVLSPGGMVAGHRMGVTAKRRQIGVSNTYTNDRSLWRKIRFTNEVLQVSMRFIITYLRAFYRLIPSDSELEIAQWLERGLTDWKVRGSNPTSISRLVSSKPGKPGSISTLVLPLDGMAARRRMGVTAESNTLSERPSWDPGQPLAYYLFYFYLFYRKFGKEISIKIWFSPLLCTEGNTTVPGV